MHVCVAGKNEIAVGILEALVERCGTSVISVLPNRTDSGEHGWQPSLRRRAKELRVEEVDLPEVYHLPRLLFLSLEFDRLIRPSRFDEARLINVHFSLLPKYKGMYTSAWPLLNGEEETGVTLHLIDEGIDTGEIIAQKTIPIGASDTARDLYVSYMRRGEELVLSHLDRLLDLSTDLETRPQPSEGASYYSRSSLDYSALEVDLRKTAWEIHNQIRAYTFREFQLPSVAGHVVKGSTILPTRSTEVPGTVVGETSHAFTVATVDYDLEVHRDLLPVALEYCDDQRLGDLSELLTHLDDPNEADAEGRRLLPVAVASGNVEMVQALISHGADPHLTDWSGETCADIVEEMDDGPEKDAMISALRATGAQGGATE